MSVTFKERPILFSAPMVNAILAGKKTQTRRIIGAKQLPSELYRKGRPHFDEQLNAWVWNHDYEFERYCWFACPYGGIGDRLWVRETWGWDFGHGGQLTDSTLTYRADGKQVPFDNSQLRLESRYGEWRPSIFMPRWASRITLEITDVRVERLQDITEEDALAEGFKPGAFVTARDHFESLWDTLNEKRGYGWETSPWVWVITFKRSDK